MPARDRSLEPVDAFSLVGHEVRFGVLETVFDEAATAVPWRTIREGLEVRDPGRLNYHLSELCPHFLRRTAEGYVLQRPGYATVRLVRAGRLTDRGHLAATGIGDCVRCGGHLRLTYDPDQFGLVTCPDCERWFVRWLLPPGALAERSAERVATVLDQRCRAARRSGNAGICPLCSGPMTRQLTDGTRHEHPAGLAYRCGRCACRFDSTVAAAVLSHPAVVAFHHDHGVDVGARPLWRLPFAFAPEAVAVVERGPSRVVLTWRLGAERLRCAVTEAGEVDEATVEPA